MLTNHFDQLNDAMDDCDWTLFPKKIQKVLPIIIQNTQKPIVLRTFEKSSCSRESFKRVSFLSEDVFSSFYNSIVPIYQFLLMYLFCVHQVANGGFSLFMIFREFR